MRLSFNSVQLYCVRDGPVPMCARNRGSPISRSHQSCPLFSSVLTLNVRFWQGLTPGIRKFEARCTILFCIVTVVDFIGTSSCEKSAKLQRTALDEDTARVRRKAQSCSVLDNAE
ncbi:hypothetical protein CYLTODRAFT_185707 [Cylindrobasidium torrendii FP15055 ss-10]|uniref:Uncharacterized protein n=1 Tax=Cylindrobasidium torrendii FP15055 ss-10 TaxID=1314674 RepID=A0A0D7AVY6_9AGAR|nr:hypothetical protein CYLTODRAFT_185707 [Cylindrobasidium torrendii FP15055 ss-10]